MKARRIAVLMPLALTIAGGAAAQGKCELKLERGALKDAQLSLTKAEFGQLAERQKAVQKAVTLLTENPDKIRNEAGRNYLLAQALAWWTAKGGVPAVAPRATVGYPGSGTVDLVAATDTAIRALEAAAPQCADEIDQVRRNAWAPWIGGAGNFINSNQLDSAKAYITRAQLFYPNSPYTSYYSAVVAQNAQDFAAGAQWYRKTVEQITPEMIQSDTSFGSLERNAAYNAAFLTLLAADHAPDGDKAARMKEAAAAFKAYIDTYPNGENVAEARSGMARALQGTGDTAAVAQVFGEMLANPGNYTDLQLFEAGTNAFNAERREEAAKLLEAGLAKNPWHRDALYNLTNTYLALQDQPKMLAAGQKLVSIDPNNPDNWRLLAAAHQLPAKKIEAEFNTARRDPKRTARANELRKQMAALNDSVLKYFEKFEKAPARVTVTSFRHDESRHQLAGTIENLTGAAASYTMKVEFLDAQGNVVTSGTTAVSAGPKEKKEFRVEATGTGIVAWRYAPIA